MPKWSPDGKFLSLRVDSRSPTPRSFATTSPNVASDYDIGALDHSHPLSIEEENQLGGELYLLFKTDAVDLVGLRRTSPLLQFTAATEGIVLYEREPGIYRRYRWRACKLWEDNRWRHERRKQYVERFLARVGLR